MSKQNSKIKRTYPKPKCNNDKLCKPQYYFDTTEECKECKKVQ
ncbi:hypothetical protein ACIVBQ_000444 [Tenacibaculum discolor]